MNYHPRDLRKKRESWKYFFSFERNTKAYTLLYAFGGMFILFSKPIFEIFVIPFIPEDNIKKLRQHFEEQYKEKWKH